MNACALPHYPIKDTKLAEVAEELNHLPKPKVQTGIVQKLNKKDKTQMKQDANTKEIKSE